MEYRFHKTTPGHSRVSYTDSRSQARRNQSVYMKAWPKPSLLHVHAPWNCISDHCILRRTVCILTCAHREARHGRICTRTTPLHELYETPTRYTRCAYFNDLINCRHGQYVQWLSSLYRFSHLSPKIIRRPFFLRLSFFSFPPFFFYYTRAIGNWFTGL